MHCTHDTQEGLVRKATSDGVQYLKSMCVPGWLLCCSISVTAERWVPLLEVKEAELLGWLKKQKAAG